MDKKQCTASYHGTLFWREERTTFTQTFSVESVWRCLGESLDPDTSLQHLLYAKLFFGFVGVLRIIQIMLCLNFVRVR